MAQNSNYLNQHNLAADFFPRRSLFVVGSDGGYGGYVEPASSSHYIAIQSGPYTTSIVPHTNAQMTVSGSYSWGASNQPQWYYH